MDGHMWDSPTKIHGVQLGGHADLITNPAVQKSYIDKALIPLLQHIASSSNARYVLGYNIVSEPEINMKGFGGGVGLDGDAVKRFVKNCSDAVHANGGGAYATVGCYMPDYLPTWQYVGLDFYELHYYPWMDNQHSPGSGLPTSASLSLDKPCIVGEFATQDASYGLTDTNPLSAEWYLDTIYAYGYAGALGWSIRSYDSASNWDEFEPVFVNWALQHPNTP